MSDEGRTFSRLVLEGAERAKSSTRFAGRSRHVTGGVMLSNDGESVVIVFFRGQILDVSDPAQLGVTWDYEITGSGEDWEKLLSGALDLTQALVPLFSGLRVRGDIVKFNGHMEAIVELIRILNSVWAGTTHSAFQVDERRKGQSDNAGYWDVQSECFGQYLAVSGIRTYFERVGRGARLNVLGIHPAGRDGRQWQKLADNLADVATFYVPDLPGHGKSWPLPGEECIRTMEDLSAFLWEFIDAVDSRGPWVVAGCSIGGNLVLQMALDRPNSLSAVVSLEGADFTPTMSEAAIALMDHPQVSVKHSYRDRTITLIGGKAGPEAREYLLWEAACYSPTSLQADLAAYGRFDVRDRMGEIILPVLLLRGTADWLVTERMVRETADRLRSASVSVVMPEDIGHFPPVEDPEGTANIIREFFRVHELI